jgi:transposase
MSLHPEPIGEIPEETKRIAEAAFPKGNIYMKMRGELGTFYCDEDFEKLFPRRGQPAESPWRLALILVLQFAEGLSDRQAAEAVRARIDWKYALGLELSDPGFDYSVLSEFRARLLSGGAEELLLNKMLERFKAKGLLKARGKQRTDSTHILSAVRELNRLESVGETLRAALNSLSAVAPDWLRAQITPDWFERYGRRVEEYRLPRGEQKRAEYAARIGSDGFHILNAVESGNAPPQLRQLEAVRILRQMWEDQYLNEDGKVRWRSGKEVAPAGERFNSPYDTQAHFGDKRSVTWVGYKVHLTETCDDDQAHLITQVETTSAVVPDVKASEVILSALEDNELLPEQHFVDCGYIDIKWLIESRENRGVSVIGPVRPDPHWQARGEASCVAGRFEVDWENRQVKCPAGETASQWSDLSRTRGEGWFQVRFSPSQCGPCSLREQCTKSPHGRALLLRPRVEYEVLQAARQEQQTPEWKKRYDRRAGIEGTISQAVRVAGMRRTRYIGQSKTHLQNILTAAAINIIRVIAWILEIPPAKTRISHFARLANATG